MQDVNHRMVQAGDRIIFTNEHTNYTLRPSELADASPFMYHMFWHVAKQKPAKVVKRPAASMDAAEMVDDDAAADDDDAETGMGDALLEGAYGVASWPAGRRAGELSAPCRGLHL